MNPYNVGIGQFAVTALYVIVLAFLWRILSAKFATANSPIIQNIGSAMGATL